MEKLFVSSALVTNLLGFAQHRGLNTIDLSHRIGFDSKAMGSEHNASQMLPLRQMMMLYEVLQTKTKDDQIGIHVGERYNIAALGLVGQLIQTSSNVEQALQKAIEYFGLMSNGLAMKLHQHKGRCRLDLSINQACQTAFPEASKQLICASMAFVFQELAYLTHTTFEPTSVGFTFSDPNPSEYKRVFGKTPNFGLKTNFLEFDPTLLERKILFSDYELLMVLEQVACERISNIQSVKATLKTQIEQVVYSLLDPKVPSVETVALNMNMSPRSIQRKLMQEGTTYTEIMEGVKRTLSLTYLKKDLSVKEMGYTEPSSFVTAFKKWFGTTPAHFRTLL